MTTMTLHDAQSTLPDVIRGLIPGEEVLITENDRVVAKLTPIASKPPTKKRLLGTARGTVLFMAPDFDAPLEDFKEYME